MQTLLQNVRRGNPSVFLEACKSRFDLLPTCVIVGWGLCLCNFMQILLQVAGETCLDRWLCFERLIVGCAFASARYEIAIKLLRRNKAGCGQFSAREKRNYVFRSDGIDNIDLLIESRISCFVVIWSVLAFVLLGQMF